MALFTVGKKTMNGILKFYGAILGIAVIIAGLFLSVYSLMNNSFMGGMALYLGISGIVIGAIIAVAAWKTS